MKCTRCGKEFDSTIAELNAEHYDHNVCACPHCGKAYYFYCQKRIVAVDYDGCAETDDWGEPIVPDKDYKKKKK